MSTSKKFLSSRYSFILALVLGMALAVGVSVWATSVGTNVTITGTLTTSSTSASSTVGYALGVATTTPGATFSVAGNGYFTTGVGAGILVTSTGRIVANVDLGVATTTPAQALSVVGSGYLTVGLGVGIATTSAGTIENTGNALFGDAAADLVMFNSANLRYNNVGTTTLPTSAVSWAYATSSANIGLLKFDTTNTRVGISTTTPGDTLAVSGSGMFFNKEATTTLSIQSGKANTGGCIELNNGATVFSLYATTANVVAVWQSGSCR